MIFSVFMTELFKIANDYGGQIEKNTGDGLMAYFVGEGQNKRVDACEKATAAALSMFFVTEHLINPLLIRSGFQTIDFRIGIDYGRVTIARVGAARIFNSNVAIGISANIASKMLRDAGKNEIIIGNDVYIFFDARQEKPLHDFQNGHSVFLLSVTALLTLITITSLMHDGWFQHE